MQSVRPAVKKLVGVTDLDEQRSIQPARKPDSSFEREFETALNFCIFCAVERLWPIGHVDCDVIEIEVARGVARHVDHADPEVGIAEVAR